MDQYYLKKHYFQDQALWQMNADKGTLRPMLFAKIGE